MKKRIWITEIVLSLSVFMSSMLINNKIFYYDAWLYWTLGEKTGNLREWPVTIRGIWLPMILGICQKVSNFLFDNSFIIFRLLYAAICVVLLTLIFPYLLNIVLGTIHWMTGSFFCILLFMLFWRDMVLCPLSDMVALMLYALFLSGIKYLYLSALNNQNSRMLLNYIYAFLIGIVTYLMYNIRTIYIIPVAVIMLMCLSFIFVKRMWFLLKYSILAIIGFLVTSVPEIIVNYYRYHSYSFFVNTATAGKDNLFIAQLVWGISISRYETFIGPKDEYPQIGVKFINLLGSNISKGVDIKTLPEFVKFAFSNIIELCGIYVQHFFSGITLFWNEVYLHDIRVNKTIYLLNVLLFLLFLLVIISGSIMKYTEATKRKINVLVICLLLLPVMISLPGAIETRFFLAVYCIMYVILTLKVSYTKLFKWSRLHLGKCIVIILLGFGVWCMSANNLLSEIQYANLDYNSNIFYKQSVGE